MVCILSISLYLFVCANWRKILDSEKECILAKFIQYTFVEENIYYAIYLQWMADDNNKVHDLKQLTRKK